MKINLQNTVYFEFFVLFSLLVRFFFFISFNEQRINKQKKTSIYCSRISRKRRTAERTAAAVDVE